MVIVAFAVRATAGQPEVGVAVAAEEAQPEIIYRHVHADQEAGVGVVQTSGIVITRDATPAAKALLPDREGPTVAIRRTAVSLPVGNGRADHIAQAVVSTMKQDDTHEDCSITAMVDQMRPQLAQTFGEQDRACATVSPTSSRRGIQPHDDHSDPTLVPQNRR